MVRSGKLKVEKKYEDMAQGPKLIGQRKDQIRLPEESPFPSVINFNIACHYTPFR